MHILYLSIFHPQEFMPGRPDITADQVKLASRAKQDTDQCAHLYISAMLLFLIQKSCNQRT